MNLKKILCPVDFSENSVRAFKTAAQLARAFRADLRVLHVIEAQVVPSNLMPIDTLDQQIMTVEEKALRALETLIAAWGKDLESDQTMVDVTTGHAASEIVASARMYQIDLTVIGAKGIKLLEESVIGGTAETVVKNAGCSVLVVRN